MPLEVRDGGILFCNGSVGVFESVKLLSKGPSFSRNLFTLSATTCSMDAAVDVARATNGTITTDRTGIRFAWAC